MGLAIEYLELHPRIRVAQTAIGFVMVEHNFACEGPSEEAAEVGRFT
jgi:hypothetical protein